MIFFAQSEGYEDYLLFGVQKELVYNQHEYYRLITYMFDHGNLMHLVLNMMALYSLASIVPMFMEERFSIIIYFIAGIGSGIATSLQSYTITVGASGAIYGIFGILIYYAYQEYKSGNRAMLRSFAPVIIINLIISFTPGISLVGHVSGFIIGIIGALIYDKKNNRKVW
jgi:rhomboid protease GluP